MTRRPSEALTHFAKAISLEPKYAEALVGQATAYRFLGLLDEAEAANKEALEIDPSLGSAYFGLGFLYSRKDKKQAQ